MYHVELYDRVNDGYYTDSSHQNKFNADSRCLELNHRGQFSRVVDARGEICTR